MAKQASSDAVRDVWTERREAIRESIHNIGSKMTRYAEQLPEDQLLAKADKVKIATEIAGKIVGLDKQEDKNVVNIALLGSYSDMDTIDVESKSVPMLHATE
jgi:hypothetical protein